MGDDLRERIVVLETNHKHVVMAINEFKEAQAENNRLLKKMHEELSLYKFTIKLVKFIGISVIFALAFKFGDIKSLWQDVIK